MAQPQFLALLSDLPAFAVWDLLGHSLHCVATTAHQTWQKPVGQENSHKAEGNVFLVTKKSSIKRRADEIFRFTG